MAAERRAYGRARRLVEHHRRRVERERQVVPLQDQLRPRSIQRQLAPPCPRSPPNPCPPSRPMARPASSSGSTSIPTPSARAWRRPACSWALARRRGGRGRGAACASQRAARRTTPGSNDAYSNNFSPAFRDLYQKYYSLQGKDAVDKVPEYHGKMKELRSTCARAPERRAAPLFDDREPPPRRGRAGRHGALRRPAEQGLPATTHGSTLKTYRTRPPTSTTTSTPSGPRSARRRPRSTATPRRPGAAPR
jgi:hypothetical protein